MNHDMAHDIRTILVYSLYRNLHGIGSTAKDVNEWQARAIEMYRHNTLFNAQVRQIEALIFQTIEFYQNHPTATHEDRKRHEERSYGRHQLCALASMNAQRNGEHP